MSSVVMSRPSIGSGRPRLPRCLVCDRDLADTELATCQDVHAACPAQPEITFLDKVRAAAPVAGWPDSRCSADLVCPRCAALINDIVIYESRLADMTQQLVVMVTNTTQSRAVAAEVAAPSADKPRARRPRKAPPKKNKPAEASTTSQGAAVGVGPGQQQQGHAVPLDDFGEPEDADDPMAIGTSTDPGGSAGPSSGSGESSLEEEEEEGPTEDPLCLDTQGLSAATPSTTDKSMPPPSEPPKRVPISSLFEVTSGARPFTCQVCRKQYADKSSIYAHVKLHLGVRPFRCEICTRSFVRRSQLVTHSAVHSDERPFVCTACPATFRQQSALIAHRKIHTGERSHRCTQCDKAFRGSHELRVHSQTHAGLKTHCCDVCGGMFSTAKILVRHKMIHSGHKPHTCSVCGQSFRVRPALRDHMRVHTGERPFVCEVCGKRFARPQILASHRRVHTGERPYVCPRCGKGFSQCTPLKKHVQSGVCCARAAPADMTAPQVVSALAALPPVVPSVQSVACPVCYLYLSDAEALETHKKAAHGLGVAVVPVVGLEATGPMGTGQ